MSLVITIVLLGLLASLSPSTIVVFILLLASTRARVNAAAFLLGWSLSLVVVFAVSYLLGGAHAASQAGGRFAADVEVLLGLALVAVAGRQWRHRDTPRTGSGVTKSLTGHLKQLAPWEAAIVGVVEQPWTLTAAAAVVVVRHHPAFVIAVIAFFVFAILSTATVGLTLLYSLRRPGDAESHLATLRNRLVEAGPTIFVVVSLAVGLFLIADGLIAAL